MHAEADSPLPPGCAADSTGKETRDPHRAEQLLPIGDYKGFGLAMVVDIMCGLLTGMPTGNAVSAMFGTSMAERRFLGQFYGAIRIDAFSDPEHFKNRLQDLADRVRREPAVDPARPVVVPGDPEKAHEADRLTNGIPVPAADLERLNELAERYQRTGLNSQSG